VISFLFICFCLVPLAAAAGDFDGSKPLICAAIKVLECTTKGECDEVSAASVNLPRFLKFDFAGKTISGKLEGSQEKTSGIEGMKRIKGKLILHGGEEGMGWSMIISEAAGNMTLTAADDQVGFVVFGACTTD